MTTRLDKQITGNVGLYYCCYQLSLRGWNVMPTARNAKGVDIVIYNADATKYLGVQVETLSGKHDVPLGSALSIMGDYWVILTEVATGKPTVFVLTPEEVRAGAWLQGKHARWPHSEAAGRACCDVSGLSPSGLPKGSPAVARATPSTVERRLRSLACWPVDG